MKAKKLEFIWENFLDLVVSLKNRDLARSVVTGLLTKTEKTMLAKRALAMIMLENGIPETDVAKSLSLSVSTVYSYSRLVDAADKPFSRVSGIRGKIKSVEVLEELGRGKLGFTKGSLKVYP